jgi:outer membrane protein TolC
MKSLRPLFFIFICAALAGAKELSLHDAQAALFANNLDLMVAGQQVQIARLSLSETRATWQPSLDFFANYGYQTKKPKSQLNLPASVVSTLPPAMASALGTPMEINMQDRTELGIDLSYPLFAGFTRLNAQKAKQLGVDGQQAAFSALKNQLSLRLALVYFRWEVGRKQCAVQQALVNQLAALAAQRSEQYKGGTIAKSALLDAQARKETAAVDLMASFDLVDSLKTELMNLIQSSDSSIFPQTYAFPVIDTTGTLNTGRPELVALDKSNEQLAATKSILAGSRLPFVAGKAGYHYGKPGLNNGINEFMDYGVAGVNLTWNLYDGMKTHAQKAQIDAQQEMLKKQKGLLVDQF